MTLEELANRIEDVWQVVRRHKHRGQAIDSTEVLSTADSGNIGISVSPSSSISPSGAVTSLSVSAKMWLNTTQNIGDGSLIKVEWDEASFANGITTDPVSHRFNIPDDGEYHIHAQVLYGLPNLNQKLITYIVKNSDFSNPLSRNTMVANNPDGGSAIPMGPVVDDILRLEAGDTIEIWTFHTYFTEPDLTLQAGEEYSFCYIYKL